MNAQKQPKTTVEKLTVANQIVSLVGGGLTIASILIPLTVSFITAIRAKKAAMKQLEDNTETQTVSPESVEDGKQ